MNFALRPSDLTRNGKHHLQRQFIQAHEAGNSINAIMAKSPLPPTTTYRWMNIEMSPEAQAKRQQHFRRTLLLFDFEEREIIRMATELRKNHLAVTIEVTRALIEKATHGRISNCSNSSVSRFWKKHNWPSRRVQQRNQIEIRDSLPEEVSRFRNEVTEYVDQNNVPTSCIHVMDETGLWNGSVVSRTYCDPSTMDSGVLGNGDHKRDTGVVAISGSGSIDPFFIHHSPQRTKTINGHRTIVNRGVSGMGMEQMDHWVSHFGTNHQAPHSVLLMDRLKCHTNKNIVNRLESEFNVKVFHFPPQGAKLASVCDNSFFSVLKSRMAKRDTSTSEKKEAVFKELCSNFEAPIIQNFWRHCGWNWRQSNGQNNLHE